LTLDGTALTVQTNAIDNPYIDPALQGHVYDVVHFNWHFRVAMQKPSVLSQSVLKFLLKLGDIESSIKAAIRDKLVDANISWDSMPPTISLAVRKAFLAGLRAALRQRALLGELVSQWIGQSRGGLSLS
jgi:hypothetical protein